MSLVGSGSRRTTPHPEGALRQLEAGPGPGNELLPDTALPRARTILGQGGLVVGRAAPGGLLGYAALARRTSLGRLTQYAWGRIVQWATYLVKVKDLKPTTRRAPPGAQAAFFSDLSAPNGPRPGSTYGGECQQFSTGDPTWCVPVMSGALWARCLVPRTPGDSSAAV